MPELSFRLRWPDASETLNYSPSTIVERYFTPGASYPVGAFVALSRDAMQAASARVEQKYGHPCTRARATLAAIEQTSKRFEAQADAVVTLVAFQA